MKQLPRQQDAQFSQPPPPYPYQNDEISLVDLAKTLVRRWKLMATIFVVIVAAGLIYALVMPTKYEYTSIYNAAQISAGEELESTDGLQSKVTSVYIPQQIRAQLQQKNLLQLPFNVSVSSPKGTNLIVLTSKVAEDKQQLVADLHNAILEQLKSEQDKQITQRITVLQQRLNATKQQFESLKSSSSSKSNDLAANIMTKISDLETEIDSFQVGNITAQATQSLTSKNTSKSLIMALAIILAGMIAVIGVFIREFASHVCDSLKED